MLHLKKHTRRFCNKPTVVKICGCLGGLYVLLMLSSMTAEDPSVFVSSPPLDAHWQTVVDDRIFVYSAYLDEREIKGHIRIISLLGKGLIRQIVKPLFNTKLCVIKYQNSKKTDVVPATEFQVQAGYGRIYHPGTYECTSDPKLIPYTVTLVDTSAQTLPNSLLINIPNTSQKPIYKWINCLQPNRLNRDSYAVRELVEFMELARLQGMSKVSFYEVQGERNNSDLYMKYVHYYRRLGLIDVHKWNFDKAGTRSSGQMAAMNDCLYRYMYKTEINTNVDLDETIFSPSNSKTWREVEKQLDNEAKKQRHDYCGFVFTKERMYTYGSGKELEMSDETRKKYFPENWSAMVQPHVKKETVALIDQRNIKLLKTFVKANYTILEKMAYYPARIKLVRTNDYLDCYKGEILHANPEIISLKHYRRSFHRVWQDTVEAGWLNRCLAFLKGDYYYQTVFPIGPHPTWKNNLKYFFGGYPKLAEHNDTTILKYADDLAQGIDLVYRIVNAS